MAHASPYRFSRPGIAIPVTVAILSIVFALSACGLETEPGPGNQAGSSTSGAGATSGHGGEGGAGASGGSGGTTGGDGGDSGDDGGSGTTGGSGASGGDGGMTGGVGGMTGGVGGDSAVPTCDKDSECDADRPQCNGSGECAPCTSQSACEDRTATPRCALASASVHRGECVECANDNQCTSDSRPHCFENSCKECADHNDCPADEPQCKDGTCGACNSVAACQDRTDTPTCVISGAKTGQCVECVQDASCENPTPQCSTATRSCVPCDGEAACDGRNGMEHCNTREGVETSGRCVQCTGATEVAECGGNSCKQATGECTDNPLGDTNTCGECEADSECGGSDKCVRQVLATMDLGTFCFPAPPGGCATVNSLARPYSVSQSTSSIDGHAATYCQPRTSCQAYLDATIHMTVPGAKPCAEDTQCGIGNPEVDGAYCIPNTFSVMEARLHCSYACEESADCPETGFDTCPMGAGIKFCQP